MLTLSLCLSAIVGINAILGGEVTAVKIAEDKWMCADDCAYGVAPDGKDTVHSPLGGCAGAPLLPGYSERRHRAGDIQLPECEFGKNRFDCMSFRSPSGKSGTMEWSEVEKQLKEARAQDGQGSPKKPVDCTVEASKACFKCQNEPNPSFDKCSQRGVEASEKCSQQYVDLIFAHRSDRQTPMEETVRAFNHIISTGKVLYWGTSQWRADEIAQAWRVADRLGLIGPLMEQPSYNMLEREKVQSEFTLLYRAPGLGLTVFSPLRLGILTGKYQNGIPDNSRLAQAGDKFTTAFWSHHSKAEWDAIITAVGKLQPIAERLGIKMATLALAWVLKNPNVSSAVTGASSPAQVYDNVRAIGAVEKLTPDIMAEIDLVLDNKPPTILERLPAGQK